MREVEQISLVLLGAVNDALDADHKLSLKAMLDAIPKAAAAIAALRAQDREGAQSIVDLLADAQPTVSRYGDEIVLHCPDGTITNDLYDAIEAAAGRDALPLSPVRTEDGNA